MAPHPVKCVLFDMDGLLLDTENLYSEGTQSILAQYGKVFTWDFKAKCMGQSTMEVARMMVQHYELPLEPHEYIQRSQAVYKEIFPRVKSLPGVARLVHHLAKHRVPIAVATSSTTSSYDLKTEKHSGLFSLFDHLVRGDHPAVKQAKPAPDIFLVACQQFSDMKPEDCLVVEDSPLGVEAAIAAGMQVLMIPDSRLDPSLTKAATICLDSLNAIKPEMFGLPPVSYQPVSHIIFDMDGLLINTQEMYSRVSSEILAKHGKEPDWDFKMKVIGRKSVEVAEMAVKHYSLPYTGEEYLKIHEEALTASFPTCQLLPGVERLVRHLHQHRIPMAVATSSTRAMLELKTNQKHSSLFSLFSHIVTGCEPEVVRGKPEPDIYNIARLRFPERPAAERCLVFEDAPNGVDSGLAAGMQVVMVPHHKVQKPYLLAATQVLASLEHFQPQDFGLPPFSSQD